MNVFKYLDYRKIIIAAITERKKTEPKLTYAAVAEQMRIQKGFLSRVLKGKADLTSDQIFKFADLFDFTETAIEYIFSVYEFQRAGTESKRRFLHRKMKLIRSKHLNAADLIDAEKVATEFASPIFEYYLDPNNLLVHVLLGIEKYRKSPALLESVLGIEPTKLESILSNLQKLDIIRKENGRISINKMSLHLPKDQFMLDHYLSSTRVRSLMQLHKSKPKDKNIYSFSFTADEAAFEKITVDFLEFIKKVQSETATTEPTVGYQINFDLFKWTK
jgi:uncharacterized protein (TIGR02147 family)